MRILHTSDWHLGKTLEGLSRMEEQKQFIDELCEISDREAIDMILIAGDIFDTYNPSSAAEELFYKAVERLNRKGQRPILIIAGNHDSPDRLCASSPLAYKNGIILLGYPGSDAGAYKCESSAMEIKAAGPGWLELRLDKYSYSAIIITLPYPSESRLEEVLSEDSGEAKLQKAYSDKIGSILNTLSQRFREDAVNLIISHIYLRDSRISDSERQLGGALVVDPEAIPATAHYAALGHLHRPQKIKAAPSPTYYSGSPLAYSFSETDYSKAVFVVDAEPGKAADIKEVHLSAGKPLRQWKCLNGLEEAASWCEAEKDMNCWIDLEIHTDRVISPEEQKSLREMHPGIINIRPVIKAAQDKELSYISRETRRIDELFKDYFIYKMGVEASEELMNEFLEVINYNDEEAESQSGGEAVETKIS